MILPNDSIQILQVARLVTFSPTRLSLPILKSIFFFPAPPPLPSLPLGLTVPPVLEMPVELQLLLAAGKSTGLRGTFSSNGLMSFCC